MSMLTSRKYWKIGKLPLRFVLVVPFLLQIMAAVGLTGWVSLQNGEKAVNELASQLRDEVSARIEQKLHDHLSTAPLVNRINVDAIQSGYLDPKNSDQTKQYLFNQLQQFPNLSGITIALEQPNYVGVIHDRTKQAVILTLWNQESKGITDFVVNPQGQTIEVIPDPDYDHRQRPWYQAAVKARKSIWQEPYVTVEPVRMVISADLPFYDRQGKLMGVADAEQTLTGISEFLQQLKVGKTGLTFIIDRKGELVATSTPQAPFKINPQTQEPERLPAIASSNARVQQIAQQLQQRFPELKTLRDRQQFDFALIQSTTQKTSQEHLFVQVVPYQPVEGLDWIIVTAVPEADFMETIHANTRTTVLLCLLAFAIATGLGMLTARRLVRPILQVVYAADALSQGNWQKPLHQSHLRELNLLTQAFNRMASHLQNSFSILEHNACHDSLTGLLNQAAFRQRLQEAIARRNYQASFTNTPHSYLFAVLFLDLDYFKLVNDSYGHLVGDQLLIATTQRLKDCVRGTDAIARFGGDEFVILLDKIANLNEATHIAERITVELKRPFHLSNTDIFISTSIGIILSSSGGDDADSFLRNADIAVYRAKANGKAGYEVFDHAMHTDILDRMQLETELRHALDRQEFQVYYQPIVDVYTQKIQGFEALIRWFHPTKGMVSPSVFIPVAEEIGLINDIGWWVLQQSCQQMYQWQMQYPDFSAMRISVNLSAKQFSQRDAIAQIRQILALTQLSPSSLKLEITESILMHSTEVTRDRLMQLHDLGIHLSVDDFGTGYSSLSYIHRFPVSTLKIDQSFISRLGDRQSKQEIVEIITLMATKLGMDTIAEGVETWEQLKYLQHIGCQQAQGFLFSPPVPKDQAEALLKGDNRMALT
jgi:diguanylate cyclase (GGDEF)-like protein